MGEIADWSIDQIIDEWANPDNEDPREDDYPPTPYRRHCIYCGAVGLRWMQTGGAWRLEDRNGAIHNCQFYARARNFNQP